MTFVVTSGASQNIAYNYGLTVKKISSHLALLVQLLADGIVIGVEQRTRHLENQELVRPLLLLGDYQMPQALDGPFLTPIAVTTGSFALTKIYIRPSSTRMYRHIKSS